MELDRLCEIYNELKMNYFGDSLQTSLDLEERYSYYAEVIEDSAYDDIKETLVSAAYELISNSPEEYEVVVKKIREGFLPNHELADEEILVLAATFVAKYFKICQDKRAASNQGSEWASDPEMFEYYGSSGRAIFSGYDSYMDSHSGGDYVLLETALQYWVNNKAMGSR